MCFGLLSRFRQKTSKYVSPADFSRNRTKMCKQREYNKNFENVIDLQF